MRCARSEATLGIVNSAQPCLQSEGRVGGSIMCTTRIKPALGLRIECTNLLLLQVPCAPQSARQHSVSPPAFGHRSAASAG